MIPNHVKQKILKKVILLEKFGMSDLTWEKDSAKELIILLMEDEIGILGGSVYKIDAGKLIPLYDNWACAPLLEETNTEFNYKSKKKAYEYIDKYPVYEGEKIIFSLVFTENIN